jgi:hypothetical protein
MEPLHYIIDILCIIAFIVDRVFRLRSIKEYKEAKEAQIGNLQQQLDSERHNNDVAITEMHKRRYENLKLILDDKEAEINKSQKMILKLKTTLKETKAQEDMVYQSLVDEFHRLASRKKLLESERQVLLQEEIPVPRMRDQAKSGA